MVPLIIDTPEPREWLRQSDTALGFSSNPNTMFNLAKTPVQTMYVTTEQAKQFDLPTRTTKCACGETICLVDEEEQVDFVVCDACYEDAPYRQRY